MLHAPGADGDRAVTALSGAGQFTLFSYFAPYFQQVLGAERRRDQPAVLLVRRVRADRQRAAVAAASTASARRARSLVLLALVAVACCSGRSPRSIAAMALVLVPWGFGCFPSTRRSRRGSASPRRRWPGADGAQHLGDLPRPGRRRGRRRLRSRPRAGYWLALRWLGRHRTGLGPRRGHRRGDSAPACWAARRTPQLGDRSAVRRRRRSAQPRSPRELFVTFNRLALQGFGGVLAVAQRELVERERWLSQAEFVEMLAISQVLPGPNVVNLALMLGDRYFGLRGALAALAGMLLVPLGDRPRAGRAVRRVRHLRAGRRRVARHGRGRRRPGDRHRRQAAPALRQPAWARRRGASALLTFVAIVVRWPLRGCCSGSARRRWR